MKKFISALSSFVIAATAMGGTMTFSTDAAVSETIVSIRSNGVHEVEAKAGQKVPVTVYIPQSSGFNAVQLKFAIGKDGNLDETIGQGDIVDRNKNVIKNYKYAFGNYGIKFKNKGGNIEGEAVDFVYPNCLESGAAQNNGKGDTMLAGDLKYTTSLAMVNEETWSVLYQAETEIKAGKNVDSFGAWEAAGGEPNGKFDYASYTPVTEWSKDEPWAYKHAFMDFELELPNDLADGVYDFTVYTKEYVNTHPSSLFNDNNEMFPEDQIGRVTSNFNSPNGKQPFSVEKLVIKVGDAPTTGTTPAPTTTPAPSTTPEPGTPAQLDGDTIIYNLIPSGKDYESAQQTGKKNNVYKAQPNEKIAIDWTIKNDQGTAGIQMNFDFTQVKLESADKGNAYRVNPTFSDNTIAKQLKDGECVYTWAQSSALTAGDDKVIYTFNVQAPANAGTYSVGLSTSDINKVVPVDETKPHKFQFYGLDIVVDGPTPETTPAPSTTPEPGTPAQIDADTIIYNLIPSGKDYTSAQEKGLKNNVYNAQPNEKIAIDWTIKNDQGTAGIQMNFDFTQVKLESADKGNAYRVNPTFSDNTIAKQLKDGECVYTWAQSSALTAGDDKVIYTFNVQAPEAAGTYSVGLSTSDINKVVPVDETKPHKFAFFGLDIVVGGPVTTPEPVVTTPEPVVETTPGPTGETTPAPTTETTPAPIAETTPNPVTTPNPGTPATVLYGDVNCDGDVRINDVVLLNKYLAKNATVTAQGLLNADCEKDDKVDTKDATKIKQFLALLIDRSELGKKS